MLKVTISTAALGMNAKQCHSVDSSWCQGEKEWKRWTPALWYCAVSYYVLLLHQIQIDRCWIKAVRRIVSWFARLSRCKYVSIRRPITCWVEQISCIRHPYISNTSSLCATWIVHRNAFYHLLHGKQYLIDLICRLLLLRWPWYPRGLIPDW